MVIFTDLFVLNAVNHSYCPDLETHPSREAPLGIIFTVVIRHNVPFLLPFTTVLRGHTLWHVAWLCCELWRSDALSCRAIVLRRRVLPSCSAVCPSAMMLCRHVVLSRHAVIWYYVVSMMGWSFISIGPSLIIASAAVIMVMSVSVVMLWLLSSCSWLISVTFAGHRGALSTLLWSLSLLSLLSPSSASTSFLFLSFFV